MDRPRIHELIVPGLFAPAESGVPSPTPGVLGRILGRGRVFADPAESWESLLSLHLGYRQPDAGQRTWFVWPVRLIPGIRDLVAQPILDLTPDEWRSLREAAEPEFAALGAEWTVEGRAPFEFRLSENGVWEGLPPSAGWGRPLRAYPLTAPVQRRLQVFLGALPLVWSGHPVNAERSRSGRANVQSLWVWSPGIPAFAPEVGRVSGGATLTRRLSEMAGAAWSEDFFDPEARVVIVESLLRFRDGPRRDEVLESLAEDLLGMRLRQLRKGRLDALVVRDPGVLQVQLSRWEARRFWRRPGSLQDLARLAGHA